MPSFIPATGRTQHVAGVCLNRIGKEASTNEQRDRKLVRYHPVRSKGCLSNKTTLAMIFKLAEAPERSWRRLDGHNQLPKVILGIKFTDGIAVVRTQAQAAA
jgi:hypothetical protein